MSVRMGLLAILADGPTHGYQLKTSFEQRTGAVWSVNVGQVYTTLDRLDADGQVEEVLADEDAGGARDRRLWKITAAGKEALDEWFDDAPVPAAPPRDDFLVKVLLALHRSRHEALDVIDRQRTALYRIVQSDRRRSRDRPGTDEATTDAIAAVLIAEATTARHEADLRWLDRCEELVLAHDAQEGQQ